MAFGYSIVLSDPTAAADPQDSIARAALTDALANWSNYISGTGTLIVQLNVEPLGAPTSNSLFTLGEGGPTEDTYLGQSGGDSLDQSSALTELTTGVHVASSDITITLNSQILSGITSVSSYDLVTVFEHELMHGFGMSGFRSQSGAIGTTESRFDALSVLSASGADNFVGAAAEFVYGGPVPLTTKLAGSDYYHLGTTGTFADPAILYNDIMDPVAGAGRSISALDVAILDDLGMPLTAAGYELYDPNPTLTAQSLSVAGAAVTDPVIAGVTQPGEQVTLSANGVVVATTIANSAGAWSIDPTSLADGTYVLAASVPDANQTLTDSVNITLNATGAVQTIYTQALGRAADLAGLAFYRQLLVSGTSVATIRANMAQSTEAQSDIGQIYTAVLGRAVDPSGLAALINYLAGGGTQAAIRVATANSAESQTDIGQIYTAVLGRGVDASGLAASVNYLAGGGTQAAIRVATANSAESQSDIGQIYTAVLGRGVDASGLAASVNYLAGGGTQAAIRLATANSAESRTDIGQIYTAVLGRGVDASGLTASVNYLASGGTQATIRLATANSVEAQTDIGQIYTAVLGRGVDASGLAASVNYLAGGGTQAAIRLATAQSVESQADIGQIYLAELGRAVDQSSLAAIVSSLAAGNTQTLVRTSVGDSAEAFAAINSRFTAILGRAASTTDISSWQSALVAGSSLSALQTTLATSAEFAGDVNGFAQTALGHTLDSATLASYEQAASSGASLATVKLDIASSAESVGNINAAFALQPSVTPPNAVEIAGDESELVAGVTLPTLQAQIAQLSGGTAPSQASLELLTTINPVTIGTTAPSFVYGLLNNNALQAAQPDSVQAGYSGLSGVALISGFNVATDIIQVRTQQAASFAVIQTDLQTGGSSTLITLHGASQIVLSNIAPSQLTAANFRFV